MKKFDGTEATGRPAESVCPWIDRLSTEMPPIVGKRIQRIKLRVWTRLELLKKMHPKMDAGE